MKKELLLIPYTHRFIAYTDGNKCERKVIASCALPNERKMIGNADRVGHIEDVAVLKEFQGMGVA